jgi:ribosome-associated protein
MGKQNSSMDLASVIADAMFDKKASKIIVMDMRSINGASFDVFVICEAVSAIQVKAIADGVEEQVFKQLHEHPLHSEGFENAEWILLDYGDVVVHVFQERIREHIKLEELWSDAKTTKPDEKKPVVTKALKPKAATKTASRSKISKSKIATKAASKPKVSKSKIATKTASRSKVSKSKVATKTVSKSKVLKSKIATETASKSKVSKSKIATKTTSKSKVVTKTASKPKVSKSKVATKTVNKTEIAKSKPVKKSTTKKTIKNINGTTKSATATTGAKRKK